MTLNEKKGILLVERGVYIMLLRDWLKKNNVKAYKFAAEIGIAAATLYRSMGGKQRLSARYGVRIEEVTNGEVSRLEAIWPEEYSKTTSTSTSDKIIEMPKS